MVFVKMVILFRRTAKLDEEPTKEELFETITVLSNGKVPGEDGIPVEFFFKGK